ncbi:MAG: T9SS type A sorting domain-containing protein, partial [Candidatus Cloacimonetes bacterium]|nr:T9SS type A sorting domain-containing protein [Candidatus Cloacimonadota bacterium]
AGRSPATTIYFTAEDAEHAEIIIYNIKGQLVKTLECNNNVIAEATESLYYIIWDGTDENNQTISSGVYLYQLKVDGKQIDTKKCLLLK